MNEPIVGSRNLISSLREVVERSGLDPEALAVIFEADNHGHVRLADRHSLNLSDGEKTACWKVPALRELFRGERLPPADIDHYPPEYVPLFYTLEYQVLTLCEAIGDRTDQEMEEIYSALRRRPEGRSLSAIHDLIWQFAALLLGTPALSEREFEAMMGALLSSTRKWGMRPISRNYSAYLRQTFEEDSDSPAY